MLKDIKYFSSTPIEMLYCSHVMNFNQSFCDLHYHPDFLQEIENFSMKSVQASSTNQNTNATVMSALLWLVLTGTNLEPAGRNMWESNVVMQKQNKKSL